MGENYIQEPSSASVSPTMVSSLACRGAHSWILSDGGGPLTNTPWWPWWMAYPLGPLLAQTVWHCMWQPLQHVLFPASPSPPLCVQGQSRHFHLLRFYSRLLKVTLATSLPYLKLDIKSWVPRARAPKSRHFCFSSHKFWSLWLSALKIQPQDPPLSLTSTCQLILSLHRAFLSYRARHFPSSSTLELTIVVDLLHS